MIIILSLIGMAALLDAASYHIPALWRLMDRAIDATRYTPLEEDDNADQA